MGQLDALPGLHRNYLDRLILELRIDSRFTGLALSGSFSNARMDEFSDLDLVLGVRDQDYEETLNRRTEIAKLIPDFLAGFTGEHVGEPSILICLYGPPMLHVDLNFVPDSKFQTIVADHDSEELEHDFLFVPKAKTMSQTVRYQWLEDRYWVWLHYVSTKIGRGELFESLDFLGFIRAQVLAPMGRDYYGIDGFGVRKIEQLKPEFAMDLKETVAGYEIQEICKAVEQSTRLYLKFREAKEESLSLHQRARIEALNYFDQIRARVLDQDQLQAGN